MRQLFLHLLMLCHIMILHHQFVVDMAYLSDSESHHVGLFSAGASFSYSDHVEDFSSDSETMFEDGFVFIPDSDLSDPSKWTDSSGNYMVHKAILWKLYTSNHLIFLSLMI